MWWLPLAAIGGIGAFFVLGAIAIHELTHKTIGIGKWLYKLILIGGTGLIIFILAVFIIGV